MEIYKKIINKKTLTDSYFYINVFLTNTYDNIGMFTDIPVFGVTNDNPISLMEKFGRPDGSSVDKWYSEVSNEVSGQTDSRLEELRRYNLSTPYTVGFDIEAIRYVDYKGVLINGVSRVTKYDDIEKIYVFDANEDLDIGTNAQKTGLRYFDNSGGTYFKFFNQGNNATNTSLSGIIKEDYLIGVTDVLETKSNIFIDRGSVSVSENILKMSEINNLEQLIAYGNGFFKIINNQ